jgi:serine/threonine protein kinase
MIDTPDESLYRTMRKEGKKSIHRERILAYSTVGTPDYIAPEVLSQKVGVYFDRACLHVNVFCVFGPKQQRYERVTSSSKCHAV